MAGFFFDLKALGIPEAESLIRDIGNDMRHGLLGRLKQAAKLVSDDAKARTTSRRVRAAITYEAAAQSPFDFRAVVGPVRKKAFFAHFLEFGTKGSPKHRATRAFPFLIPAGEAKEDEVVELVGAPFLLRGRS